MKTCAKLTCVMNERLGLQDGALSDFALGGSRGPWRPGTTADRGGERSL